MLVVPECNTITCASASARQASSTKETVKFVVRASASAGRRRAAPDNSGVDSLTNDAQGVGRNHRVCPVDTLS